MAYQLPLQISREDNLWMARSASIQGFLATGETIDQLLGELPAVAEALFAVCQENGWTFVKDAPQVRPGDIVWVFQVPHPVIQAA